jgi:formate dehydrogenase maturation protein FdhE
MPAYLWNWARASLLEEAEVIKPNEALQFCPTCNAWPMALTAVETMRGWWRVGRFRCGRCKHEQDQVDMCQQRDPVPRTFRK